MIRFLSAIFILVLAASAARADYAEGFGHYDQGRYQDAFVIWKAGAEKGDALAQISLASLYEQGLGTDQDLGRAAYWYEQAALAGDPVAQTIMGDWHRLGYGVKASLIRAYAWYDLANATIERDRVGQSLDYHARLEAERLKREWGF